MKIILVKKDDYGYQGLVSFLKGLGHEVIVEKSEDQFENQIKEAEAFYKKDKIVTISVDLKDEISEQDVIIYHGYEAYEKKRVCSNIEKYSFIADSLYMIDNLMDYNYNVLINRSLDASNSIDISELKDKIVRLNGPSLCIGNGGSYAASMFASKVLESKNRIIAIDKQPRDILYNDIKLYDNVFAVTYNNRNYGVIRALEKAKNDGLSTYVLTKGNQSDNIDTLIKYSSNLSSEYSFISIASTFMPMSVMLKYYTEFSDEDLNQLINNIYASSKDIIIDDIDRMPVIEIMSGDNTYVSSKLLKSSIVESGIGIPVEHEKYDYCHGPSNLSYKNKNSVLIYLLNGEKTELDSLELEYLKPYYKQIILLETKEKDKIIGEYDLAMKGIFLCKRIAELQNTNLCKFEYSPIVKKVYRFNKGM